MSTIPPPFRGFGYIRMIYPELRRCFTPGLYLRRTCGALNRLFSYGTNSPSHIVGVR